MNTLNLLAVAGLTLALALMLLSEHVGVLLGRRSRMRRGGAGGEGQVTAVEAAVLGLLGLLLGFSFSSGLARFGERRALIVREANAIGTAYLRADLLPERERAELRQALCDYSGTRIDLFERGFGEEFTRIVQRSTDLHALIWDKAIEGVRAAPATTMAVLPPINEVIDLHTTRISAMMRHAPLAALVGLLLTAMLGITLVGYSFGLGNTPHRWVSRSFAVLSAAVLWINVDLDYPRAGMVRTSNEAMVEVHEWLLRDLASSER